MLDELEAKLEEALCDAAVALSSAASKEKSWRAEVAAVCAKALMPLAPGMELWVDAKLKHEAIEKLASGSLVERGRIVLAQYESDQYKKWEEEDGDYPCLLAYPLEIRISYKNSWRTFYEDLESLLLSGAEHRVMLFVEDGASHVIEALEEGERFIRAFQGRPAGRRFLLGGYRLEEKSFEFCSVIL